MLKRVLLFLSVISVSTLAMATADMKVSKGQLETVTQFPSKLIPQRDIYVWLPPGYRTDAKYDVLYMHDGQMLFDATTTWNKQEWQVDEVAGQLIEDGTVRPFIVVGIPNAGELRQSEYMPQKPFEKLSQEQQSSVYQQERSPNVLFYGGPVYSDRYLQFIVEELIPYIEQRYPVYSGPQHRFLGGSSMGGLISWYGVMEYPQVFGGAICLSTHWPGDYSKGGAAFEQILQYLNQNLPKLADQRLYFDHGDATLDALYPPLQAQVDAVLSKMSAPSVQWESRNFEQADHSENAWASRLHIPFTFLFSRP